jgi:hypothetical protein
MKFNYKNLYTIASMKKIDDIPKDKWGYRYNGKILTYNDIKKLNNHEDILNVINNYKPKVIFFNKYKVVDNKEEVVKSLNSVSFYLKLQDVDIKMSIDENDNLLFNDDHSLAKLYLNGRLSFNQCKYISKTLDKEDDIICYDKEFFFRKPKDIICITNNIASICNIDRESIMSIGSMDYDYIITGFSEFRKTKDIHD